MDVDSFKCVIVCGMCGEWFGDIDSITKHVITHTYVKVVDRGEWSASDSTNRAQSQQNIPGEGPNVTDNYQRDFFQTEGTDVSINITNNSQQDAFSNEFNLDIPTATVKSLSQSIHKTAFPYVASILSDNSQDRHMNMYRNNVAATTPHASQQHFNINDYPTTDTTNWMMTGIPNYNSEKGSNSNANTIRTRTQNNGYPLATSEGPPYKYDTNVGYNFTIGHDNDRSTWHYSNSVLMYPNKSQSWKDEATIKIDNASVGTHGDPTSTFGFDESTRAMDDLSEQCRMDNCSNTRRNGLTSPKVSKSRTILRPQLDLDESINCMDENFVCVVTEQDTSESEYSRGTLCGVDNHYSNCELKSTTDDESTSREGGSHDIIFNTILTNVNQRDPCSSREDGLNHEHSNTIPHVYKSVDSSLSSSFSADLGKINLLDKGDGMDRGSKLERHQTEMKEYVKCVHNIQSDVKSTRGNLAKPIHIQDQGNTVVPDHISEEAKGIEGHGYRIMQMQHVRGKRGSCTLSKPFTCKAGRNDPNVKASNCHSDMHISNDDPESPTYIQGLNFDWSNKVQNENPLRCNVCWQTFFYVQDLHQHIKRHTPICPVCRWIFSNEDDLRAHMKVHQNYAEKHWKDITASHRASTDGKRDPAGEINCCFQCRILFPTLDDLERHTSVHRHDVNMGKTKNIFDSFFSKVMGSNRKKYLCKACPKSFVYKFSAKIHLNKHLGKRVTCQVCEDTFSTRSSLIRHEQRKHRMSERGGNQNESGDKAVSVVVKSGYNDRSLNFKHIADDVDRTLKGLDVGIPYCWVCKKWFSSVQYTWTHIKKHMTVRERRIPLLEFKCFECYKKFDTEKNLKTHMDLHFKQKLHTCGTCKKTFPSIECVSNHMIEHRQQAHTPYTCSSCGRGFDLSITLKNHKKKCKYSFLGDSPMVLPLKCEKCWKFFPDARRLYRHGQIHSLRRKHSCPVCQRSYFRREALRYHMVQKKHQVPDAKGSKLSTTSIRNHPRKLQATKLLPPVQNKNTMK